MSESDTDPYCLHCQIGTFLRAWMMENPDDDLPYIVQKLAEVLADVIASEPDLHNREIGVQLVHKVLDDQVEEAATTFHRQVN